MQPFNSNREGSANWVPEEFTTLRVYDSVETNARGNNIAYDVMPLRWGNTRHSEDFVQDDFHVTVYRAGETDYPDIKDFTADAQFLGDQDIVVWAATPVHHLPRDEDGTYVGGNFRGSALAMYNRVMLRPRNVFDQTPFYRP